MPRLIAGMTLPANVQDRVTGYCYEIVARNNKLWQIETHPDDPSHRALRRAAYMVGSGQHAIAFVAAENGFLTELPAGWFGATGWRMNPGYELKNHRFGRPITASCIACHATSAVHDAPATNRFPLVETGIDCSRCHGDPRPHVAFWKASPHEDPPPETNLVHPGRLPADRANDVCLQCHLQGDVTVPLRRSSPLDFRPGRRLLDERHDILIAGQPESLGIASHGARMLQSRCYTASGGKLTCIHCHDAHRPVSDFSSTYYDTKCQPCHQPQACNRTRTDDDRRSTSACVGCHMPKRPTREGLHLVFTDHAILRQPATSERVPPPLTTNAKVELVSAWPGVKSDAATLGAAYVLLHETMGPQLPSLRLGRELLSEAIVANPLDIESRYWLGSAWLALDRPQEARDQLQRVLNEQPARHDARYRLALAEEAAGNPQRAIRHYERLITEAPNWPQPLARLAQLHLAGQQAAEAMRVSRRLSALEPSAAAYASLALAERLAGGGHDQALATVGKAIELDSREPAAYVARGTLRLLAGQSDVARVDFERAIKLDPANASAQQALRALSGSR
jgi:tetratricopeptide repeat protein/cytochrome c554/c'-like protein